MTVIPVLPPSLIPVDDSTNVAIGDTPSQAPIIVAEASIMNA